MSGRRFRELFLALTVRPAQIVAGAKRGASASSSGRTRGRPRGDAAAVGLSDLYLTTIVSPDSSLGRDALDAGGRPARR